MNNCVHNEYVGLHNRYLKHASNGLSYDKSIVNSILDELVAEFKPGWTGPLTLTEFMDTKKGAMLSRYSSAVRKVNAGGFDIRKHNTTSAFVKNELYEEVKPPRMIINRDTRFNLAYGRYTIALEKCMMAVKQFSKGRNFIERGNQFDALLNFQDSWILEGDASKFEGTQRPELLAHIELGIWKRLLNDKQFKEMCMIFASKMQKRGHTSNGMKFKFFGCRGSGDMDTGLFNSILMWVACRYFEIVNKFTWSGCFIVDGDDNGIRIPKSETYINTFAEFGFDAKLIIRKDYHDFDYCSGKFIKINNTQFMYVQNIIKIINNMSVFRKIKFNHCKAEYYHSLGYMYKVIYGNMPMFREFSNFLLRSTEGCHVRTEILKELNPVYLDYFASNREVILDRSDLNNINLEVELAMSFDINLGYLNDICKFFDGNFIKFEKDETRRYNSTRQRDEQLTATEIIQCETLLEVF